MTVYLTPETRRRWMMMQARVFDPPPSPNIAEQIQQFSDKFAKAMEPIGLEFMTVTQRVTEAVMPAIVEFYRRFTVDIFPDTQDDYARVE